MFRGISFATLEIEKLIIKLVCLVVCVFSSSLDASMFQKYSFRRKINYFYIAEQSN